MYATIGEAGSSGGGSSSNAPAGSSSLFNRNSRRKDVREKESALQQELMRLKLERDRETEAQKDVLRGLKLVVSNVKAGNLPEDFDLALELCDEINNLIVKNEPIDAPKAWGCWGIDPPPKLPRVARAVKP
eukprot:4014892-Prymnesium_polylepis.1